MNRKEIYQNEINPAAYIAREIESRKRARKDNIAAFLLVLAAVAVFAAVQIGYGVW